MGDFDDVERLQAGLRGWLLRTARGGRHELRGIGAPAVLPLLCGAAFGPAIAAGGVAPPGVAGMGVLSCVGADALALLLSDADGRVRSGSISGQQQSRSLEREISRSIGEVLAGGGKGADDLRSDIAMVMREIDAGGTVFRAAIEAGDTELQREVLAAFEALGAEFGELAFMLADLARAAGEIQDSLGSQGAELRAASERAWRQAADVRMIREDLAVIEARTGRWQPEPAEPGPRWTSGCPYRGLLPYDKAHEAVFYGRERLTAELAGKLAGTGIVIVTGAPGAGKTSVLQAGLVPALARGVQLPGSSSWPVISVTATARPLTGLAAGLASRCGGDPAAIRGMLAGAPGEAHLLIREIMPQPADVSPLVLIVDQFEQVFAAAGADERRERAAFIDAVCAAARPAGLRAGPAARVVIAVRADHWDQCAAYPQLIRAMEQDQLVVGPMPEASLRRVVTGPAEASGLRADGALVDAIVADVRAAAAAPGRAVLPMVSAALALTWENRDGGRLTLDGYARAGRVAGAIETGAEAAYAALAEDQRPVARDVLRRMTAVGADRRPVRQPLSRAGLRAGRQKNQQAAIGAVLDAFTRAGLLVLGTETAGISHDVVLQEWPRLRGWLEEDKASLILAGQLAEDTARWRQSRKDSALLYRGIQLAAAQQAARVWAADPGRYPALAGGEADFLRASGRAGGWRRWRRRTLVAFVIMLLLAGLAGEGLAVRSARNSAARQRTTDASARLAAQSTALEAADPVTAALLAAAAWRIAPTAQARYSLLEALAQPLRGILAAPGAAPTAVAYGPGGKTLAAGYAGGTIRLWDVASHRLVSTATWDGAPEALAFARGGRALEVASPAAVGTWDLANRATIAAQPLPGATGGRSVAFSPGGSTLATGGGDGNVRLWDVAARQEIGAPMSSDLRPVEAVAFSPDGTTVAAASSDGMVQLWNAATQREAGVTMATGPAPVGALAFSPGGKFLATGGEDGNVRLWAVASQGQVGAVMPTGSPVAALAFNASGTTIGVAGTREPTELWSFATQQQTGAALGAAGASALAFSPGASALAFSPGAGVLATGEGNGSIALWDPAFFHQSSLLAGFGSPGSSAAGAVAALGGHGDVLAVSDGRGTILLRDVLTGQAGGRSIISPRTVTGLAVSPDGKTLAVTAGGLQLWSAATGQRIGGPLPAAGSAGPPAFSPDGALVAAIGADGKARLWDVITRRETGTAMAVGAGPDMGAVALALSPDGSTLATGGADGGIRLWDTATRQEIGTPMMTAGAGPVSALAFSRDGATLTAAAGDGSARRWDVSFPAGLLAAACSIAGQSLTREQWAGYAGTQPFRQVCSP